MKLIKSLCIAFAMYSKIPVPQFEWKEEDMKYSLCFFPLVGGVIACCFLLLKNTADILELGTCSVTLLLAALPLLITGGIHIDGYMDTMDAIHSYQEKEKKLEILKDPHIGAFSVIMLVLYYLIYLAALSELKEIQAVEMTAAGFVLSRTLAAAGLLTLKPAKKNGLLRIFADTASKKIVLAVLALEGCLCIAGMMILSPLVACFILGSLVLWYIYYKHLCYKEFGGVTGDTSGYFITICELIIVIMSVIGFRL